MAKLSTELKSQIKQAVRHPAAWWKGADLPEESVRPWEGGIQFLAAVFPRFMDGFLSVQGRIYVGDAPGMIRYNHRSIADVIKTVWDGLNDPLIGIYMDRKRFGADVHRWIMRLAATICPLISLFQCFNLGLTPTQRLISWIVLDIFSNSVWTANEVSSAKIWAGITPHSQQRGQLQMFRSVGDTVGALFSGLPWTVIGFAPNFGIELTTYQVMIWGAVIFAPLALFSKWLPSFAKQRVDYTVKVSAEGDAPSEGDLQPEEHISLRENFAIVRHNRWFMMWLVIDFVKLLAPGTDRMMLYQFLLTEKTLFGKKFNGMALKTLLDITLEWPCFVLSPLAAKAVEKLGGPARFIKTHMAVILGSQVLSFLVGYKTWPRLIFMKVMETCRDTMTNWSSVAHNMISYEMFDYVEWKTGYRSEGLTQSIDGILKKLIKNNIGNVIGNAVTDWTGFQSWDTPAAQQPARFMDTLWPLLHINDIFGQIVGLIGMAWFKYPHDPREIEVDLIERRALAQKMKEEAEVA